MIKRLVSVAALAIAASFAVGTVQAEQLKVSNYLPPNHLFQKMLESWSDELNEKSGGELSFDIYPSSQLGPANRQYDLVTNGVADIAVILISATPGRFPMTELAGQPMTYPSTGADSASMSRRLTELAPTYLADEFDGTRILYMAMTPPLKLHTAKKKITKLEDIQGLRIRYAGQVFQDMLSAFGASPLPVAPGDTSDGLSKGIIDGATFPYEATKSFDLGPVLSYSMMPGLASAPFAVIMSQEKYDSLSPDLQKLLDETGGPDRAEAFGAMVDAGEAESEDYLIKNNVEIVTLSDEEQARLREAVHPLVQSAIDRVAATGKPAQEFYDAWSE